MDTCKQGTSGGFYLPLVQAVSWLWERQDVWMGKEAASGTAFLLWISGTMQLHGMFVYERPACSRKYEAVSGSDRTIHRGRDQAGAYLKEGKKEWKKAWKKEKRKVSSSLAWILVFLKMRSWTNCRLNWEYPYRRRRSIFWIIRMRYAWIHKSCRIPVSREAKHLPDVGFAKMFLDAAGRQYELI